MEMNRKKIGLIISIVVLVIIFTIWSILVANHKLDAIDKTIVNGIVSSRGDKYNFIYWLNRITTEFGYTYVIVGIIIVALIICKLSTKSLILAGMTLFTKISNDFVKNIINRPRPAEDFRWMSESSSSYPSGHTMTATFFYGFIAYLIIRSNLNKKIKYSLFGICVFLIPWVGLTRMILSVHYFSDVIGGFLGGIVMISIAILLFEIIGDRKIVKNKSE